MGKLVVYKLVKVLVLVFSLSIILASTLALLGKYIPPEKLLHSQWLILLLPFILGLLLVLAVYWLSQKKWLIVGLLLLSFGSHYDYLASKVQFSMRPTHAIDKTIKVISYNINLFSYPPYLSTTSFIADFLFQENPDIVCFQEFPKLNQKDTESLADLFSFLPYYQIVETNEESLCLAIFSKHPIQSCNAIPFKDSNNLAMNAVLYINNKKIQIINCHLQTTNWNQSKRLLQLSGNNFSSFKQIIEINSLKRAKQARIIRQQIKETSLPCIVCGDFNDTPASYVYQHISKNLQDSFRTSGKGFRYTYKHLKKWFCIDYILYSEDSFISTSYHSPKLNYSDHHPIVSELKFK